MKRKVFISLVMLLMFVCCLCFNSNLTVSAASGLDNLPVFNGEDGSQGNTTLGVGDENDEGETCSTNNLPVFNGEDGSQGN
ncbi:MAG: hypothetical protein IJX78_03870, partial [Bacilli bacterium]|nr:hypothetical protein [Bacilli bacterium]